MDGLNKLIAVIRVAKALRHVQNPREANSRLLPRRLAFLLRTGDTFTVPVLCLLTRAALIAAA